MPPVPTDPDAPVGAPLYPPAEWFARPASLQPGRKITVVTEGPDAGRVFGYVAPKDQCILSGRERTECWKVPDSPSNYAAAMQGETLTAEGLTIPTANIGGDVDHAHPQRASFAQARDHYANTASQVMRVVYGADEHGVWCAGALWPEITHRQAAKVRASALSGDWRWREEVGAYDMAGSQMVSTPGFPLIPKIHAYAASAGDPHPALIGGWGGDPTTQEARMGDEPTVTLTLSATETARLHALLTGQAPLVPAQRAAVGDAPCACGGHAAAAPPPVGQMVSGDGLAEALEPGAPVTREEFDALTRQVEELQGQVMADALTGIDGMVAALPLPPDLADCERFAMPAAAGWDESKHPRHPKGEKGGGKFAPKVGDRVTVTTTNGGAITGEVTATDNVGGVDVKPDGQEEPVSIDGIRVDSVAPAEDGFNAWQRANGEHVTDQIGGEEVVREQKPKPGGDPHTGPSAFDPEATARESRGKSTAPTAPKSKPSLADKPGGDPIGRIVALEGPDRTNAISELSTDEMREAIAAIESGDYADGPEQIARYGKDRAEGALERLKATVALREKNGR